MFGHGRQSREKKLDRCSPSKGICTSQSHRPACMAVAATSCSPSRAKASVDLMALASCSFAFGQSRSMHTVLPLAVRSHFVLCEGLGKFEVSESERPGAGAVATRPLTAGELLAEEAPLGTSLLFPQPGLGPPRAARAEVELSKRRDPQRPGNGLCRFLGSQRPQRIHSKPRKTAQRWLGGTDLLGTRISETPKSIKKRSQLQALPSSLVLR